MFGRIPHYKLRMGYDPMMRRTLVHMGKCSVAGSAAVLAEPKVAAWAETWVEMTASALAGPKVEAWVETMAEALDKGKVEVSEDA